MESLQTFVGRLCLAIGCHSHPNQSARMYSLKKYDSKCKGHMGVFGWVRELKRKAVFEVSSYKVLGDKAGVSDLANKVKLNLHWGREDGIIFYVEPDVGGNDYQNTVRALKAILSFKS